MVSSLGDALQADFGQKHGEGDVVVVQHTSGHSIKGHLHPQKKIANVRGLLIYTIESSSKCLVQTWKRSLVMVASL